MKKRTAFLFLFAASLCLHPAPTDAAESPPPLLIGPGRDDVSPQHLRDLRALAHHVTDTLEEPWLLDCLSIADGDEHAHGFASVKIYLTPRVRTARLIRGRSLACFSPITRSYADPDWPTLNGWFCTTRRLNEYAIVAPPDRPFAADGPFAGAFNVWGRMRDEDVVAVTDAARQAAPEQTIRSLGVREAGIVEMTGEGIGHAPKLKIDFQKTSGVWTEKKRGQWWEQ